MQLRPVHDTGTTANALRALRTSACGILINHVDRHTRTYCRSMLLSTLYAPLQHLTLKHSLSTILPHNLAQNTPLSILPNRYYHSSIHPFCGNDINTDEPLQTSGLAGASRPPPHRTLRARSARQHCHTLVDRQVHRDPSLPWGTERRGPQEGGVDRSYRAALSCLCHTTAGG